MITRPFVALLISSLVCPSVLFADNPPPPPPNYAAIESQGRSDGRPDGGREGRERGQREGQQEGERDGYRRGYDRCEREEIDKAYHSGYQRGFDEGDVEGERVGRDRGRIDGDAAGQREGYSAGSAKADDDADVAATPLGRAKGIEQANASDAPQKGDQDGIVAGDKRAKKTALDVDYPRGRQEYNASQWASAIENENQFSQKNASILEREAHGIFNEISLFQERAPSATPHYTYYHLNQHYPDPQANTAYERGYRDGYNSGFQSDYSWNYDSAYRMGFSDGERRGCWDAQQKDYSLDYQRGRREGYTRGYDAAYQPAYHSAYRIAYDAIYPRAFQQGYAATYDAAYARHFEEARAQAYRERYQELYNAAYKKAELAKFNAMYPIYAQQEYQRGWNDEAEDFRTRPVRFASAQAVEPVATLPSGLFEPGDAIRLKAQVRNFSADALSGKDVKFVVQALDANLSVLTESEATLVKDLTRKSRTTITNLLEFRMHEAAVGKTASFNVKAIYQGRLCGEQKIQVKANFMFKVALAELPALKEGLESVIKIKFTNQSKIPSSTQLAGQLKSNQLLEVLTPSASLGEVAAGDSKVATYTVIARASGGSAKIPLVVSAMQSGRRVGLMEESPEIPLINDYKIKLLNSAGGLTKKGVTRVNYNIQNVGSRVNAKSLQLSVKILGPNANAFQVVGPNPQFLSPIPKGENKSFVVPILAKVDNSGGTIELEVQEEGKTVVIHRSQFSQRLFESRGKGK